MTRPVPTAVICSGGLARGAFEAGALEVLAAAGVEPTHVIGCSAGALNAAGFAAGVRAGRIGDAIRAIVNVWDEDADWLHAFDLRPVQLLRGRGVSSSANLERILRKHIGSIVDGSTARRPVRLEMIATASEGQPHDIDGQPMTSYERVLAFDGEAFDTPRGRESVYRAAAASAAFPVLFAPVRIPGAGPCFDGGMVDETPIARAIDGGARRVVVLVPYPAVDPFRGDPPFGPTLLLHLADVLIHERLYRDVRQAKKINRALAKLRALERDGRLTHEQHDEVQSRLGWPVELEILEVRPSLPLKGSAVAGFFSRRLRREYIEAGRRAAELTLKSA